VSEATQPHPERASLRFLSTRWPSPARASRLGSGEASRVAAGAFSVLSPPVGSGRERGGHRTVHFDDDRQGVVFCGVTRRSIWGRRFGGTQRLPPLLPRRSSSASATSDARSTWKRTEAAGRSQGSTPRWWNLPRQ
jgi:hypothetical protein